MSGLVPAVIRRFEQRLRQRRETLREVLHAELVASRREEFIELAGQVHDVGDESIAALLMDVNLSGRERELEEMRDVEATLERIGQGTFGICLVCRDTIDRERLDAYPTAKRCILCQQRYEQIHNGGKDTTPSL